MDGSSDKGAPRSKEFDDVYFSKHDGLEETRHVFLKSNNLPNAWAVEDRFVIAETGFGTGLNFLAVWALFEVCDNPPTHLHFVSFEKFPLSRTNIEEYLAPWKDQFPNLLAALLEHYPDNLEGTQRIDFSDNVSLTLIFDDMNDAIVDLQTPVNCWFLDGFSPSVNPDMWSETLFENMARLSKEGASFATFTAAGFVKRGLMDAGFMVEKVKGYGRKRDMLAGYFEGGQAL